MLKYDIQPAGPVRYDIFVEADKDGLVLSGALEALVDFHRGEQAWSLAIPLARRLVALESLLRLGRISMVEWGQAVHRYLLASGAVDRANARWLWEYLLDRDPRLSFESGIAVWHFDSRDWVGNLDVPTLVIIPTADQLVPPSAQRELADLLRDSRVVELAGAKHEAVMTHGGDIA